jgi:archaetidylinositol phosphate synthase
MNTDSFKGDKKLPLKSPLARIERRFIDALVPVFPRWIEGYHLTLMTIPLSAGLVICGFLARRSLSWLWLSCACLFLQWFTDSFDGSLGRFRDTGIPKWGYYMDHLLDYVFLCSILIGYALLFDGMHRMLFLLMIPVFGLFYVSSYLAFAATHEFKITFLGTGPTELRLFLILLNTALIVFGTGFLKNVLTAVLFIACAAICLVIYRTQKYIWNIDRAEKEQKRKPV